MLPTDADDDGFVAVGCTAEGEPEDCDDGAADRYPAATELCDGLDNDCDDLVDEGALEVTQQHLGQIAGGGGLHGLSISVSSVGRPFAAGLTDASAVTGAILGPDLTGAEVVAPLAFTRDGALLALTARAVAVAALPETNVVALATTDHGNGCLRMILGQVRASVDELAVAFDEPSDVAHFDEGLADEAGARCAPDYQIATPSLAASGQDLLLAYVKAAPESRTFCRSGSSDPPSPAPVLVSAARLRNDGELARGEIPTATLLGQSVDNSAPALLGLGEGRWLVSLIAADGAIVIHAVTVVVNGDHSRELSTSEIYRLVAGSGPRDETFLALGAESDGTTTLGLSFREGCAGESRVWFQLLELDTSGTLEATTEPVVVVDSDRQDQRRPTMAWWDASSEWLVVYQRGLHQVVGRRFDDSARLVDDSLPPLLEVPEGSSGTRQALAERSVAFALSDGERIGMVGYIPGDETPGLWGARLGCGL